MAYTAKQDLLSTQLPGLQNYTLPGITTHTTIDYGDYYDNNSDTSSFEVCNMADLKAFAQVFLPTLYSLVFVAGLLGNGLVVCVLLWFRRRCNLTDICLLNLALADLLFVLSLPFWAAYAARGSWPWTGAMCRLMTFLYTMGFYGSLGFMVAMTLDRYLLIVHSTSVAAWRTFRLGLVLIGAVWALSFVASLPSVILAEVNGTDGAYTCAIQAPEGSWWSSFDYVEMNVLGWVVPITILVFCYARIIPTLLRMKTHKKHKAIKLIFAIIITFFLFWTPYHIVIFLHMLKKQGGYFNDCDLMNRLDLAMKVTETIAFTHCCLNPIIYAFAGEKFCRLVVKMLGKWLPLCSVSRDSYERRSSVFSRSSEMTSTKLI